MYVKFWGASESVTGSMHLLKTNKAYIVFDSGLFQGKKDFFKINNNFVIMPYHEFNKKVDAVLLSHAHIDHSGNIPNLYVKGFRKPVFCTKATYDLLEKMLPDSGHIQVEDAKLYNKIYKRKGINKVVEPLYTQDDAIYSLKLFEAIDYYQRIKIKDVHFSFINAAHVLGAATIVLDIELKNNKTFRIAYSVDLGRNNLPLLKPMDYPINVDLLILESTYGNRFHTDINTTLNTLDEILNTTFKQGGKVIIPAFALERTQQIAFFINRLYEMGYLPNVPVFVDSPLACDITSIFRRHVGLFNFQIREQFKIGDPFGLGYIKYVRDVKASKKLNELKGPAVIISASGMCEAGRVLHHLKNNLPNPRNTILIVGFMANNTLGRRLLERPKTVTIFGNKVKVKARIVNMDTLSSHADQNDLIFYVKNIKPKLIALVHGEKQARAVLASKLVGLGFKVFVPQKGEIINLDEFVS